jgi:hypothetical protein
MDFKKTHLHLVAQQHPIAILIQVCEHHFGELRCTLSLRCLLIKSALCSFRRGRSIPLLF